MAKARIADDVGLPAYDAAVATLAAGMTCTIGGGSHSNEAAGPLAQLPRDMIATAVRYSLQVLAERAKGNTVEVRVPPFAAVQCIEGPGHTRGTPPNVIEMDAATWLELASGSLEWMTGVEAGRIHASGQRADLSGLVPIAGLRG